MRDKTNQLFNARIGLERKQPLSNMAVTLFDELDEWLKSVIQNGDNYAEILESNASSEDELDAIFYHYQFAERAKHFLLLLRDVLYQHLKGKSLLADDQVKEVSLEAHWAESIETLGQALRELEQWATMERQKLNTNKERIKQLAQWRLQDNPWGVYKEQLLAISEQCLFLNKTGDEALRYIDIFQKIKAHVVGNAQFYLDEMENLVQRIDRALQLFDEENQASVGSLSLQLDSIEKGIQIQDLSSGFKYELENLLESLPLNWQTVVNARDGLLVRRDIEVKKKTTQWLESEVLPVLYEIWELVEEAQNGFKIAISNIRNRLQLLPENELITYEKHAQPLTILSKRLEGIQGEMVVHIASIEERLTSEFSISNSWDPVRPFLPSSLALSGRYIEGRGERIIDRIRAFAGKTKAWVPRFISQVEIEEGLSYAEKTARYVEHRKPDQDIHAYTSIFLTKGFVGSSFAAGRRNEMIHLDHLYQQWQKGYRGAILLTGRRFCGKTFMGEWAASRYFPRNTIRLVAGLETTFQGRKFPGTYNLAEALDFVKKYALQQQPLLWIDDLELWQDPKTLFLDNIQALLHFNDRFATRCFVMVATNHWAHQYLNSLANIDQGFQATLHLDMMPQEDITHALFIRHGATHKKLMMKGGAEPISKKAYRRLVASVVKAAHNNIGEAFIWWTSSAEMTEDEAVFIDFSDKYSLPENTDLDARLLLKEILWQKKTDEYRLRRQFGQAFTERYIHLLRRMLSTGLVHRLPDGGLELEDTVVNAVAGYLSKK